ncbi:MAG TPA: histidinol-phosphate transaminase [Firmicutes bacterium]|jgi:histidinol-phosphate aminotransferase|nr:histidinol-phosphate transaminase [Bacillota bacterium]
MNINAIVRNCVDKIPPYIPGKPIEEVERELGINGVIKMASNENPLGPSNEVRQVITQMIDKIQFYPDANHYYLKEALSQDLGLKPEQLLVGNGLDDVNRIVAETFLTPDDEVIIPQPTFSMYKSVTLLMNAKPILVKGLEGIGNDLEAMRKAVTDHTKLIFICNPNNPTGTIVKQATLVEFLQSLPSNIIVVLDEAYADFANDPEFPNGLELLKKFNNLMVFHTFSKIHALAGLRLGYAAANPALIGQMQKVRDPFNVNILALAAGIAALNSKKHIMLSKELVQMGRRSFYEELDELNIEYLPTQANFILIDCKQDSQDIYQYLLRNGIIVRPTHSFGLPNHIRVTFGSAEQNNRFFKVLRAAWKR